MQTTDYEIDDSEREGRERGIFFQEQTIWGKSLKFNKDDAVDRSKWRRRRLIL